jgi:short-subunit dehydrogenase
MPDIWRGTTVLITGASRGIGAAFADELAGRGADLVLVARNAADLEAVAARARARGVRVEVILSDLSMPEAPADVVRQVAGLGCTIDHLINNAGVGVHGYFVSDGPERHLQTIDVNVRAVTELAARFLSGMVDRRRGGVLNVSSESAFQGLAWLPVYSGTKAYVLTWSEAVWASLRGTGVRCCCLLPGPVDTSFFDHNDLNVRPPKFLMQSAATVARAGIRGYEADRSQVHSSWLFGFVANTTRLVPRSVAARFGMLYAQRKSENKR